MNKITCDTSSYRGLQFFRGRRRSPFALLRSARGVGERGARAAERRKQRLGLLRPSVRRPSKAVRRPREKEKSGKG